MTCIIALKDNDDIYLSSDYRVSNGDSKEELLVNKTFILNQDLMLGVAGEARFFQLLKYSFKPPRCIGKYKDPDFYINTIFIDHIQKLLKTKFHSIIDMNREVTLSSALIILKNKIYIMHNDFYIQEYNDFIAIGSGEEFAKSSLYTTEHLKNKIEISPVDRISLAMASANKFSLGVSPKFHVYKKNIKNKKIEESQYFISNNIPNK